MVKGLNSTALSIVDISIAFYLSSARISQGVSKRFSSPCSAGRRAEDGEKNRSASFDAGLKWFRAMLMKHFPFAPDFAEAEGDANGVMKRFAVE